MQYILLLSLITIIIGVLGYFIYKKTHSIAIIVGFLLIYYWTFNGAWLFVMDALSGFKGKDFGFTYYIIEKKMFPLHLDDNYFLAIIYYGIFFISMQLTMLFMFRKKETFPTNKKLPISIITTHLLLISFIAIVLSYLCVHQKFMDAYYTKTSLYYMIRCTPNKFGTLHMLFNLISVFSAYLSLVIYFSAKNVRYFYSKQTSVIYGIMIFLNILVVSLFFIIIGNKHDLMFAGIFCFLFYFSNNVKVEWKKIALIVGIIIFPLMLTDFVRGLPILNYSNMPHEEMEIYTNRKVPTYMNVLLNNEMFYGHFSMYGTLSKHVAINHGKSVLNLAESFIPKMIMPNRDEDVYTYYVNAVKAEPGQGYTIHHATGWYINFGILGLFIGGVFLGFIWSFIFRMNVRLYRIRNKFLLIAFSLAPSLFIAFIPTLIRNGFEAYKPLIVEALLMPAIVVLLAHFDVIAFLKTKFSKK